MYRLRDLKNGMFQIHSERYGAFEGTPLSIFKQAMRWGIMEKELKMAVNELHKTDDDYAEFGLFGYFLFTSRNRGAA